jgi:chromosome segregation ATPase
MWIRTPTQEDRVNSTTERSQTTAEARKAKAEVHLKQLRNEREHIRTRQQKAQERIEELNQVIMKAERSGEANTLAALRSDRRAAEESARDLDRALPVVDRDIELAQGELHAAHVACQSEQYNRLQAQQVSLLSTVQEAIETIMSAVQEKERLAVRQQTIHNGVVTGGNLNAIMIRHDLAHAISVRLQGSPAISLKTLDWSSWPMSEQGDLVR